MKKELIEEINKIKKLSCTLINENSGEKALADILIGRLVKSGEKTLPREIATFTTKNGAKAFLNVEGYRKLLTKGVLTSEEKKILHTVNKNIVKEMGAEIFIVAIKDVTKGLGRLESIALENKILDEFFDEVTSDTIKSSLNIGRLKPDTPNLDVKTFREISSTLDAAVTKEYNSVTQKFIDQIAREYPNKTTTQLIEIVLSKTKRKVWTYENVKNIAGPAFKDSTKAIGQFVEWVKAGAKGIPVGSTVKVGAAGVIFYIAFKAITGYTRKEDIAFQTEIDIIKKKYPCLFTSNGLPKWIRPEKNYYVLLYANGSTLTAVWNKESEALYYVPDKFNLENQGQMVECP
jgi:hypothetical protein